MLREFACWNWQDSTHAFVDTYSQDPRLFGLSRLGAALGAVLSRSQYDVAHVHLSQRGSFLREGVLILLCALLKRPVVATIHGSSFDAFADRHHRLVRTILGRASHIAVLSEATAAQLRAMKLQQVALVANGVADVSADRADRPASAMQSARAIFAGEFSRRKGADILLDAWPWVEAAVPNATLIVYGEPKDVEPTPLGGIVYKGRRPRSEVQEALRECQLLVLPSRAEAFPMSLLEAMAAGLPIVATDVGGVAQMIDDSEQIVAPDSPQMLAASMQRFLADTDLSSRTGARNRSRYELEFSPAVVSRAYERLYEQSVMR